MNHERSNSAIQASGGRNPLSRYCSASRPAGLLNGLLLLVLVALVLLIEGACGGYGMAT